MKSRAGLNLSKDMEVNKSSGFNKYQGIAGKKGKENDLKNRYMTNKKSYQSNTVNS